MGHEHDGDDHADHGHGHDHGDHGHEHDHGDHGHEHDHDGDGGHTHESWAHPGRFREREPSRRRDYAQRAFTVGIGGPVGSGKTALVLALCGALRDRLSLGVVTNDIFTREDAEFLHQTPRAGRGADPRRRDRRMPSRRDP